MSAEPQRRSVARWQVPDWAIWLLALAGPGVLTAVLVQFSSTEKRNYVFLYLGVVAVVGVLRGFWPALLAAAVSFALLDYFFTVPYYTFTMSQPGDVVNLLVFVAAAALVGVLASRRRQALLRAQALTQQLRDVNSELVRLNKEQAEAAQAALRLARSEQQIHALQETERLRRDLLAITTIEGGALQLELAPLDLDDAIEAAVDRLHRASPDREVVWDRDSAQVDVLGDWERLGQVFDNLLSNADRFAPESTPIVIGVTRE